MADRVDYLLDILSYGRYELPNDRSSNAYINPVITPVKGCDRRRLRASGDFFNQRMFPLLEKADDKEYSLEKAQDILMLGTEGITKYEFDSPYRFHRPVPSARGMHPCELYSIRANGVERYNPSDNSYDELFKGKDEDSNCFSIVIAADDYRLGKFYGDFSYVLCALDAGHIIGNVIVLANKLGYEVEVDYSKAVDPVGESFDSFFREQDLIVYGTLIVKKRGEKYYSPLSSKEIKVTRETDYKGYTKKMKYRNELIGLKELNEDNLVPDRISGKALSKKSVIKEDETIGKILVNRTSAHSHIGLMSIGAVEDLGEKLKWIQKGLMEYINLNHLNDFVKAEIFINQENEEYKRGYYEIDNDGLVLLADAEDSSKEWF